MMELSELQVDALTETFNIALGEAAATFSQLAGEEVLLDVPSVEFVSRDELLKRLGRAVGSRDDRVCGVSQRFWGEARFASETLLLFAEAGGLEVVRRIVGGNTGADDVTELEQDALAEIGNIIINACMASISNLFAEEMQGSLPQVLFCAANRVLSEELDGRHVLVASINMTLAEHSIRGVVLFLLDSPSVQSFVRKVEHAFAM